MITAAQAREWAEMADQGPTEPRYLRSVLAAIEASAKAGYCHYPAGAFDAQIFAYAMRADDRDKFVARLQMLGFTVRRRTDVPEGIEEWEVSW